MTLSCPLAMTLFRTYQLRNIGNTGFDISKEFSIRVNSKCCLQIVLIEHYDTLFVCYLPPGGKINKDLTELLVVSGCSKFVH